jgi:hypothetical protein
MIHPIETSYKGYRFRSRLEARWAVFFDTLPLRWRYETEGFVVVKDVCYLPDFYLPDWDVYLEVRPDLPDPGPVRDGVLAVVEHGRFTPIGKFMVAAAALWREEGDKIKPRLYMLCGTPGVPSLEGREHWRLEGREQWALNDGAVLLNLQRIDGEAHFEINAWSDDVRGNLGIWPFYRGGVCPPSGEWTESVYWPDYVVPRQYIGDGRDYASPRLMRAYHAARSARFEHGESG